LEEWIRHVVLHPNEMIQDYSCIDRSILMSKINRFMFDGEGDPLLLWDAIVFANFENKNISKIG
jgi:hypothetical protein